MASDEIVRLVDAYGRACAEHVEDLWSTEKLDAVSAARSALLAAVERVEGEREAYRRCMYRIANRANAESHNALGPEARALLAEIARELEVAAEEGAT